MQLTAIQLAFIKKAVDTAKLLGIENLIIEPNKVRAMDEKQTIVLFAEDNIPAFEFGSIGFNRLQTFASRLDIIKSTPNFQLEVSTTAGETNTVGFDKFDLKDKTSPPPMWAKVLTMTGINTSIEFRCANPGLIAIPKHRTDVDKYEFVLDDNSFPMIQKGKGAMKSDLITFDSSSKGVQIILTDDNGDTMKYKFAKDVYDIAEQEDSTPTFKYRYAINSVIALLKNQPSDSGHICLKITQKGFLTGTLNDINVYIAPIRN